MDNQTPDTLGETLVESGFAPNLYLLDINHALSVPRDFPLPAPWNLPSRMFEYPIEVCSPDGDQPRKIGLRHPLLAQSAPSCDFGQVGERFGNVAFGIDDGNHRRGQFAPS
ncbi:hypothetical protein [Sphingobium ummariense]|uniref:hypothetical protein n=1 Tax=Sphingobium ummariense TaxID=420994 RepID=UPI001377EB32|nr:hypothetical protein [Sphingobium ummariense]